MFLFWKHLPSSTLLSASTEFPAGLGRTAICCHLMHVQPLSPPLEMAQLSCHFVRILRDTSLLLCLIPDAESTQVIKIRKKYTQCFCLDKVLYQGLQKINLHPRSLVLKIRAIFVGCVLEFDAN